MDDWNPTHSDLVNRSREWLKKRQNCGVVMTEWTGTESPDAIGFTRKKSVLIECKTSKSDFNADQKKTFRKQSGRGMGDDRYYMAPPGLLSPEEVPASWGLLECHKAKIVVKKKCTTFERKITGIKRERNLLVHALRCITCELGHDPDWFRLGNSIKRKEQNEINEPSENKKVQRKTA